ncbi:hypothetical protein VaNZ11_015909 [Volvox africanus]|uniref:Uncharacterized protein n=1 Tax=Volvox africanus TaxID=51714 RepID=A0ABQ5SMM4_9CHLO|nr:hypothetical protein VaNZ11_015909 [Volvox africanus]
MKQFALISLACAIWLANKRRRNSTFSNTNEPSPAVNRSSTYVIPRAEAQDNIPAAQVASAPAGARTQPAPSTSSTDTMLQWTFLSLMSVALYLTAAKGSWDVFAVLVAAAVLQLSGQRMVWLGSDSEGSAESPGKRACLSVGTVTAQRPISGAAALKATAPTRLLLPDQRLGGVWVKDPTRSDSMDEATSAMRLNGIVRTAIRLIRGLELDPEALKAGRFDMAIFSVITFFKVRESYLLDGTVASYNRRDLRRGKHAAFVTVQPDGSIVLSVSWGEPLAGTGTDHFAIASAATEGLGPERGTADQPSMVGADGNVLVVTSTFRLVETGRTVTYRTTYVRAGRGRHHQQQQVHDNDISRVPQQRQ